MSIPFYRRAEYIDDGTYRYECLQCYQSVPIMGSNYKLSYCPHCGIKFEGFKENHDDTYEYVSGGLQTFTELIIMKKEMEQQEFKRYTTRQIYDPSKRKETIRYFFMYLAELRQQAKEEWDNLPIEFRCKDWHQDEYTFRVKRSEYHSTFRVRKSMRKKAEERLINL